MLSDSLALDSGAQQTIMSESAAKRCGYVVTYVRGLNTILIQSFMTLEYTDLLTEGFRELLRE